MRPTPVFPERGPTGPYHVKAFLSAGEADASVVNKPTQSCGRSFGEAANGEAANPSGREMTEERSRGSPASHRLCRSSGSYCRSPFSGISSEVRSIN